MEASPLPQMLISDDGRILIANERANGVFGRRIAGRHHISVLRQPDTLDRIEGVLHRTDAGGTARFMSTEASRDVVWRVTVAPVELSSGRSGALASFEDMSAEEQASQIRRDFVANVSHELRTPLTALLGFIETLRGAAREDRSAQDRFLAIMAREAERMSRLVDDLLSLSRVEAEERMRPTAPVDIDGVVRSVALSLRPLAEETKVRIEVTPQTGIAAIPGDTDQLAQVVTNLVENAIKYGASGGIVRIRLSTCEHEPSLRGPAVRIDVADDGDGIEPFHIPRLTERFYRADTHRSRERGGTGLGLAIVKHIVSRHRGRLRIVSRPGEGSTFSIILPASAQRAG